MLRAPLLPLRSCATTGGCSLRASGGPAPAPAPLTRLAGGRGWQRQRQRQRQQQQQGQWQGQGQRQQRRWVARAAAPLTESEVDEAAVQRVLTVLSPAEGSGEAGDAVMARFASEGEVRWYLRDRRNDVDETVQKMQKMLRWRRQLVQAPPSARKLQQERAQNKVVLHPHTDRQGRAVIIINVRNHKLANRDMLACQALAAETLDKAIEQMEGKQQDKVLAIFDLRGFSAFGLDSNADFEFAKFLVSLLYTYYPRRVGQVLLVGAPAVFRPVWSVVRPWLRSYGELARFSSVEGVKDYFQPDECPKFNK